MSFKRDKEEGCGDVTVEAVGDALAGFSHINAAGSVLLNAWERLSLEDRRAIAMQIEDYLSVAGLDGE
ncbi:MAG: hypothetical protein AAFV49_09070 [Pseudomonadota bacterium]